MNDLLPYKSAEYLEFARYCAMPEAMRKEEYEGISTFTEFATKYNVSINSLTNWRKRDEFWAEVARNRKLWFKDRTPNVIQALYRTILKEGRSQDVLTWFKLIEDWKDEPLIGNAFIGNNAVQQNVILTREELEEKMSKVKEFLNARDAHDNQLNSYPKASEAVVVEVKEVANEQKV